MNHLTIFYADDDADDLDFFREIAKTIDGIDLFTHSRGDDMMLALENPPPSPQLIFLDLNMPGKNGFEVLSELKKSTLHRHIPVVIFSTSTDQLNITKTREMGAHFYLPKLGDYESFKKSIQHTLSMDWKTFTPTPQNFLYTAA